MKITIYELLGKVKDKIDRSIYVKYFDRVNKKDDVMWACKENIIYKLNQLIIELNDTVEIINDTVEIVEEEKKIPEKLTQFEAPFLKGNKPDIRFSLIIDQINEIIDYLENKE